MILLVLLLIIFPVFFLQAQTQSETFTSSGTWTVPAGITQITIEAWGGGGGGGGRPNSGGGARGGGGGAYAKITINVLPGTIYNVVVGLGGQGGSRSGSSGGDGNPSSFGPGPIIRAAGGRGGSNSTFGPGGLGGAINESVGDIIFPGGNGDIGGGGGAGSNGAGGNSSAGSGGIGTENGGGNGGTTETSGNKDGGDGLNFGGGGGGAFRTGGGSGSGGSGASGKVIISWCEPPSITSQPSNQNITYGESAVFSILSGATGISYQWEVSEDNGNTWNPLVAEESSTLSFTLPTVSMSGNRYRCVVSTNDCGFTISNSATLAVNPAVITVTAGNQAVTYGTPESTVTQNGTYTLSGFTNGENSSVISGLNSTSYITNYTNTTNAGSPGITVTPVVTGLTAANYSIAATPGFVTIGKADQYIICGCFPFSKPLNEFIDEPVPLKVTASSGLPVTITLEPGSAATLNYDENLSPPYYLTDIGETGVVIIYVTQEGDVNYNAATPVTRTFDVTKSNQSISFPEIDDMTYSNGLTFDLDAVASSGLSVTYSVGSGSATVNGNTLNIMGAGEIWVTASQSGDASYNSASEVIRSFTVNKGTQTITIHVPAETLTESTQITATSTSGLPVILTLGTGSDATGLVDQGTYYTLSGPGTVGTGVIYIVGNQAGDDNFLPAGEVVQTIDLSKQNQMIDFDAISDQTYTPSLTVSLSATSTSGLNVSFTVLSGPATLSGSTLTINGTGTVEVEASQYGNSTFNPAPPVTQQFQVAKATPVITQDDILMTFGDADFPINPNSNSSGSFSFVSGNTEIFTLNGNLATIAGAGSTLLDITQQPTANYFGTTKTVLFTVSKASSTITVTGDTEYTYNASPQGPETSVVTGSTGAVSYSYAGTGSTSYGPGSTKPTSAGTYEVTATVAEDLNYAGATSAPYAFTIIKADAAINVNTYSETYNGTEYISTGSAIGVSSENLSGLDLLATANTNAGNYTDVWTFTDVTGNYNNAAGTVENTIIPKNLTISATNQVKCFGDEFIFVGTEFTTSGLVSGEIVGSVTLTSSGTALEAVAGSYAIIPSDADGGTFDPNNYAISYINGQLTVKPQPTLSGVAQAATVCEGAIATINLSGLLPEKIFSLDYTINGVTQTTKTGLYSDVLGNSSFTTPLLTAANNGQILRITAITITSETPNCSQTFSEDITLSVNQLPKLTSATFEGPVCDGSPATINLNGLLAGTIFTLYYTVDGVDQTPVTGLVADASGNAAFSTPALSVDNNGQILQIYGIEVTSETPVCYQGFAEEVMLEVGSVPTATISGDATICESEFTTISVEFTGTGPWEITTQRNGGNDVTVTNIDVNPYTFEVSEAGVYTVSAVSDANCAGTASGSATVVVNQFNMVVSDVTLTSSGAHCPEFGGPFNPDNSDYNAGVTEVIFKVTKEESATGNWTFDFGIDESGDVEVYDLVSVTGNNSIISYDGNVAGGSIDATDNTEVNFTFQIKNVPGTSLDVEFTASNGNDGICIETGSTDDNRITHVINEMPAVGSFSP